MDLATYEGAINRLIAAAELVASGAPQEQRLTALQMVAFFRLRQGPFGQQGVPQISNEELFKQTATAALTMAGRKEFLAAAALLDQARTLAGG